MKLKLRLISAAMLVLLLPSLAGCDKQSAVTVKSLLYSKMQVSSSYDGSETVCENGTWKLLWNSEKSQVSFFEKSTGNIWSPMPAGTEVTEYDEDGMPMKNNPIVESAVVLTYYDPQNIAEKEVTSRAELNDGGEVYIQEIDNGLRVIYDFSSVEIMVPVEYKIEDDRFTVSVNTKHIADNGKNYITTVSLAPFMCSVKNDTADSWLFMPDGSGTLLAVNSLDTVGNYGEKPVYGEDLTEQKYNYLSKTEQVDMPVFGMKTGNKAIFGVIEKGAEQALLCWNVGSVNTHYSAVYPKFKIRGYTTVESPKGFASYLDAKELKYFSKQPTQNKISVAYYSLSGDKAGIGGMAEVYREYLVENGGLSEKSTTEKSAFKFVGAVIQPDFFLGIPTTKIFPLTTIKEAAEITDELSDNLNGDFYIDLVGFGKSGLDVGKLAGGYSVAGELGGKKGLKQLSSKLKKNGIEWFMDFDLISFAKSGNGFSTGKSARFANQQNAWYTNFNAVTRNAINNRYYMLARNDLGKAVQLLEKKAKAMEISGISLDSLSHTVYSDYTNYNTEISGNMPSEVTKLFNSVKKNKFGLLSTAANDYAALSSDRIIDAPLYSSDYDVAFADVPFYQLVFKGYIPMNSISLNLCADKTDALLCCIESGVNPSYTLFRNYDNELITSEHSFIFGSEYTGIKDEILNTLNATNDYFESIAGAKVSDYKLLENGVRVTKFENGVTVAVNYSDTAASSELGEIPPKGYLTGRSSEK